MKKLSKMEIELNKWSTDRLLSLMSKGFMQPKHVKIAATILESRSPTPLLISKL